MAACAHGHAVFLLEGVLGGAVDQACEQAAGHVVVRRTATVVDEVDAAARELSGLPDEGSTVRLGWFASAGAGDDRVMGSIVPAARLADALRAAAAEG